jgi:uncharacterized protein (DUF3084 family)
MSDFSERARQIQQGAESVLETLRAETLLLVEQMGDADDKFEEQANLCASLQETARMQAAEIERISKDYQDKIDRRDEELAALRGQLSAKEKVVSVLSRAVGSMMTSSRHLTSVGAHALNIINRDAVGDKLVTQLRGSPQRQQPLSPESASLKKILDRAGERIPTEREAATG